MANMLDYLEWRGDLPMTQVPFCDVDSLILCNVCYAPFDGIVAEDFDDETITIAQAAQAVLKAVEAGTIHEPWHLKEDPALLAALIDAPRFADLPLTGFRNIFDQQTQEQFAAVTVLLPDGSAAACYRGTDNTLVGWKENFNLAFAEEVPAQRDAVIYLCELAAHTKRTLRTLGHSKGGNLAVYAGAFCSPKVQDRLLSVHSFDGPGFNEMVVAKEGFARLGDRCLTILPQSSIVGMLLEHAEDFRVVESGSVGLFQHNLYEWKIRRGSTIDLEERTSSSKYVDAMLKKWVADMTPELREKMINGFYSLLDATGAVTFGDLHIGAETIAAIKALSAMDPETRAAMSQAMALLRSAMQDALPALIGSDSAPFFSRVDWLNSAIEKLFPEKQ